ncbi:MIT C-terminal domain-containing protein, partial [Proteiniphilum sp. UBA5384]|uniref:MIT C-terminal domain-containing protein n=1 Tax=Proteiniphilum sp. UBA5384 TaxID=1947279 RepID=UPI0025CF62F4
YSPGWEVRVLKKSWFSDGFGFISDYLAELLHELRKQDFSTLMNQYVKFDNSLSERDLNAIRKTFSGMMKLIYPDKNFKKEEALELIDFAVERRKRVKDQLYIIDETFRAEPALFSYTVIPDGEVVSVETLERLASPGLFQPVNPEAEDDADIDIEDKNTETVQEGNTKRPRIQPSPQVKNITVRENQSGISYQLLFGDYVKGATQISIEDAYIRLPYQIKNLIEFLSLIAQLKDIDADVKVNLVTWNTDEYIPDSIDAFDEIKESVAEIGIDFNYEFKNIHDRKISTDTGWDILLGRGLDIFEPRKGYSIEEFLQEHRKCKAFSITYVRNNR